MADLFDANVITQLAENFKIDEKQFPLLGKIPRLSKQTGTACQVDIIEYSQSVVDPVLRGTNTAPVNKAIISSKIVPWVYVSANTMLAPGVYGSMRMPGTKEAIQDTANYLALEMNNLLQIVWNSWERILSKLLTTGQLMVTSSESIDFGILTDTAPASWADPNTDILGSISSAVASVIQHSGEIPTTMIVNSHTFSYLTKNNHIKTLFTGQKNIVEPIKRGITVTNGVINVLIDDFGYVNASGDWTAFIPDDTAVFVPNLDSPSWWELVAGPIDDDDAEGYLGIFSKVTPVPAQKTSKMLAVNTAYTVALKKPGAVLALDVTP